jgi:anti-sigma regulatory factor (Ser/Thr protein kinase)
MTSDHGNGHPPDPAPGSTRPHARQPSTPLTLRVQCSPEAASVARVALREWLATWHCPADLAADVTLVMSELVTNAVVHANSRANVTAIRHGQRLRLEVSDGSCDPPQLRAGHDGPGGFGLQFVATLAEDWGWTITPNGKVVWTEHRHIGPLTADTSTTALSR